MSKLKKGREIEAKFLLTLPANDVSETHFISRHRKFYYTLTLVSIALIHKNKDLTKWKVSIN